MIPRRWQSRRSLTARGRARAAALVVTGLTAAALLAGCGSTGAASTDSGPITIAYSAWPGWFPLAVAEEKGFFDAEGVDVNLKFFNDYTASIDALNAGQVDANAETLNDTIASVATGANLQIVINTDFSAGNDAVIVDKSITSIEGLKGKKIAAEAGVVDHFLLLQGLKTKGLTEKDIQFRAVPTDAAAAGFAGGQFDGVAVFAPFTVQALKRPGSHVLFSSKDYPGTIPDHIVFSKSVVDARPDDIQKIVNAWYKTIEFIKANPDEANAIMAKQAGISTAEYAGLVAGTDLLDAKRASAAFVTSDAPTSLPTTAALINPFLVSSGLTKTEAPLDGLFAPQFTDAVSSK
jgi:NitT/TauT family transport system substrate-binding protein